MLGETNNFTVDKNFALWAKSLSGCDGGNIKGKYYFCGIEWGTKEKENLKPALNPVEVAYRAENGMEIPAWVRSKEEPGYFIQDNITSVRFDQKIAKLYLAIKDQPSGKEDYKKFIMEKLLLANGDTFKLNLYPISFHSHHDHLWKKPHYDLTGISTKALYRSWCQIERFPLFRKIVADYSPKAVICVGRQYINDFILAFGGHSLVHQKRETKKIVQKSENKTREKWIEYLPINGGKTQLFILPFLSGVHGLNANDDIDATGKFIRSLCE